ncbi:MAG: diacylglycerol kinase family lipid kinase [Altibacter sp.]|uniref:diacylglycerol/lipid kinase family protein n=1 Tax=Altibacter sp. TaxID=2024823 RepID=UPI001DCE9F43|nr:diacylglycerol kinase family protein [Altibacter sp.]MBZ0327859.1 diacylglycerol kinase family lipid kinase [Altibacter sp.]
MITKIHFIVNPIAGSGHNKLDEEFLSEFFGNGFYEIQVKKSQYPKHAHELTKRSIDEGADIIVACGGDGTINEVASCLLNTQILLGIIPMGSGNGLASNLKIPKHIKKALQIIKSYKSIDIDVGTINNEIFFSNMGIGFDAHVISDFEKSTKRKLWSYITSVLRTLKKYNYSNTVKLSYDNTTETISPFLLFVSNSNELGYHMSLTPQASLQDGVLDMLIVPKLSFFYMVLFGMLFLIKKHYWLKKVRFVKTSSLHICNTSQQKMVAQKDGELLESIDNNIAITVLPRKLKVCIP